MDKSEIVRKNKQRFEYKSMEYHLMLAWENANEKGREEVEKKFPELFKDGECRWRSYSEMGNVANGYYWHTDEIIVNYNGKWQWAESDRDSEPLEFLGGVDKHRQFYGPIKPEPFEPTPPQIVEVPENDNP